MSRHILLGVLCALTATASAADLPFTVAWTAAPELASQGNSSNGLNAFGTLPDGRAVFTAVRPGATTPSFLFYDPQTDTWDWGAALPWVYPNLPTYIQPLANGQIFLVSLSQRPGFAYCYDPTNKTFVRRADLTFADGPKGYNPGLSAAITELPSGEIFVFGTVDYSGAPEVPGVIYSPATDTWRYSGARYALAESILSGLDRLRLPSGVMGVITTKGTAKKALICDNQTTVWRYLDLGCTDIDGARSRLVDQRVAFATYNDATKMRLFDLDDEQMTVQPGPSDPRGSLGLFVLSAAGRAWLGCTSTWPFGHADYGWFDGHVLDLVTRVWTDLPPGPVRLFSGESSGASCLVDLRDGGFLHVGLNKQTGAIRAQRLRVTSGGGSMAPYVAEDLPATLTLEEGTSAVLRYHLFGDIPADGVEVVAERVQGDGDVRVVDGMVQRVRSRSDVLNFRIAALTDADGAADQATVRVRVVQTGGGADPKARSIAVQVQDARQQATHLLGDVNGDGVVNALDLDEVVRYFGLTQSGN